MIYSRRTSPAAFYGFSSIKTIVAPAVTSQNGDLACTTASTYIPPPPLIADEGDTIFSGINEYAESYFGGSPKNGHLSNSTSPAGANLAALSPRNVAEIQFSAPFAYLSSEGATEGLGPMPSIGVNTYGGTVHFVIQDGNGAFSYSSKDSSNEDYGCVPQALIDWMAADPDYVSQYPYLASCYPGGPSIMPDQLSVVGPVAQSAVPDLTTSAQVNILSSGCFHPGACPTPAPAATVSPVVPARTSLPISEEAPVAAPFSSLPQSQKAAVDNSPTTNPGLGGIIAGAFGGLPFAPSPNGPISSPNAPSPNAPAPNVPFSNALPSVTTPSLSEGESPLSVPAVAAAGGSPLAPVPTALISPPAATPASYAISLAPSASAIVVNGVTSTLPIGGSNAGDEAGHPVITVGSQTIAVNSASQYVVAGQTLIPGAPPINIQGTPVSLAPSASAVLVGESTVALHVPPTVL